MTRKVALVTGASRGIGAAIAVRLARDGWDVGVHYGRTRKGAEETARAVEAAGGRAFLVAADIAQRDGAYRAVDETVAHFGRLDALVNNAGIYEREKTPEVTEETWDLTVDTNLKSMFFVTQAAAPHLPDGARIVNLASVIAASGRPHGAHYAASKAGAVSMTKCWAKEYADRGILVNAVAPGVIETDMVAQDTPETRADRLKTIPLGRLGDPAEIAGPVSFLLGPDAAYMTGTVLHVNGGIYI